MRMLLDEISILLGRLSKYTSLPNVTTCALSCVTPEMRCFPQQSCEVGIVVPIFQMRKLRTREVK